jgi:hypothetical protein
MCGSTAQPNGRSSVSLDQWLQISQILHCTAEGLRD